MSELLHSIEAWQPNLWRASWQGGLVILAAWAVARWGTFLTPRVMCWIWRLVCLKLLVTLFWTQPVAIAILPAASGPNIPATIDVEKPVSSASTTAPSPTPERFPLGEPHASTIRPNADSDGKVAIGTILVTLWIAGVSCAVALTVGRWFSAWRLCRAAATTDSELFQRLCQSEAKRLAIRRLPRIRLSPRVESPLLTGIWRPTIVLPARAAESFEEGELRLIFGHELAHLKRHDLLWNWLPTVVGWLFFFHPLVWLMKRCWLEAQEAACDELLIQSQTARPAEYARLLLKLATRSPAESRAGLAAAGVLGAYRNLERRVLAMSRVKSYSRRRFVVAASAVTVVGALIGIPWRLVAQQATTKTEQNPEQSTAVKEALARLAKSLQAMRGYDVQMTVTLDWPYKFVLADVMDPDHPTRTKKYEVQPWGPDEVPPKTVSVSRQVLSRSGQQRIELEEYDSHAEKSKRQKSLIVFDGKTIRFRPGTGDASIQMARGYCLAGYGGYPIYDGQYLTDHIPLDYLAAQQPSARVIQNPDEGSDLMGILFPAGEGKSSWPDSEFRVWLDRSHGFLPKRVEIYRRQGTEMLLYNRMDVIRFSEPVPGIWAPTEMAYTAFEIEPGPYRGQAVNVYHAVVDVDRSRWCADIDERLFLLPFPPGVQVWDFEKNLMFTTGPGDDGKDVKQLKAHATKTIAVNTGYSQHEELDLAKVRQSDRAAAATLLKYEAELKTNEAGAIKSVAVDVDPRYDGRGGPNLDDEGLSFVGKLRDLEQLHLGNTNITDAGLRHLEGLKHLKVLVLENTKITDAGLKHLASLENLRRLYLDNNIIRDGKPVRAVRITDEGIGSLKTLTRLEDLVLDRTQITDRGLERLQDMRSLRNLYLFGTSVTDEGVAKFKQALPNCQVARDRPPAATERKAPADQRAPVAPKAQGSDDLREDERKAAPLLATIAKEYGYALNADQNLQHVAPPFPAMRKELYRVMRPEQARDIPAGPTAIVFRWSNDGLATRNTTMTYSGSNPFANGQRLAGLLDNLMGIKKPMIDGPRELLDTTLTGDWVVRKGASDEQVVKELTTVLRKDFALRMRLEFHTVERPVYVVDGVYGYKPAPGGDKDTATREGRTLTNDVIEIFGKDLTRNIAGGGFGNFPTFLDWLGDWIGTPIVSDAKETPSGELSWFLHARRPSTKELEAEDHDPQLVLANITAQTGLTFSKETRSIRILFVSREK